MRENQITIPQYEFISFLKVDIYKQAGEHVRGYIEGVVPEGMATKYIQKHRDGDTVDIFATANGGEKQLMHGLISDIYSDHTNDVEKLCIRFISLTIKTDIIKVKRSYQKDSSTYSEVTGILSSEGEGTYLIPDHEGDSIGSMLLQYDETDWVFAKRLASRLNTVVIPNYLLDRPYLSLGITSRPSYELRSTEYSFGKDMSLYRENIAQGVPFSENESLFFQVQSREIFDLCDQIQFKGNTLCVYSIETHLEGAQLIHTYELRPKGGFKVREKFNFDVIGAEIDGVIKEVQTDIVKVQLSIDTRACADKWFPYDTIYSSPDGTGWYFMPEIGDAIRLQIPSEHEEEAHVISAVHMAQNATRSNPDVKSISTKYGKAFVYEPTGLHWTNGTGSTISLIDDKGIEIKTSEDLIIRADGNITMVCDEKIFVQANDNIILDQGGNQLKIDENIDLTAGHVRLR